MCISMHTPFTTPIAKDIVGVKRAIAEMRHHKNRAA
jgi:hypothetical protein